MDAKFRCDDALADDSTDIVGAHGVFAKHCSPFGQSVCNTNI